jgi:hypothetical protein
MERTGRFLAKRKEVTDASNGETIYWILELLSLGTKFQRHGQNEFCAWISVKDFQVSL